MVILREDKDSLGLTMRDVFSFCLGLVLSLAFYVNTVCAVEPTLGSKESNQQTENQKHKEEIGIDDLLGPEDHFPFLPDNHRDAGTGKFMRLN